MARAYGLTGALLLALLSAVPSGAEVWPQGTYLGVASCSSTACHGSTTPKNDFGIDQTEYRTWGGKGPKPDKHFNAFTVLSQPLGQRIARNMRIGDPTKARECLVCHEPPVKKTLPSYAKGDGVSCEHCHGPAAKWKESHAKGGVPHEQNVALGMIDTKDLAVRAAQCLKCHLGTGDRRVDHVLIGAGHPDLTFELDTFTGQMPVHWKTDKNPLEHVRAWAIGQAVHLKSQLEYFRDTAQKGTWPDYARLDCSACHHDLTQPSLSWRQAAMKGQRKPGHAQLNLAQYEVFKHLVREVSPPVAGQLANAMQSVDATMYALIPGKKAAAVASDRAASLIDSMLPRLKSASMDISLVDRLLRSIANDGQRIALAGPRAALQAVWAVDLLVRVPHQPNRWREADHKDIKALIDEMFHHVDNVSGYSAPRFTEQMAK
jgi:hypothetical protein